MHYSNFKIITTTLLSFIIFFNIPNPGFSQNTNSSEGSLSSNSSVNFNYNFTFQNNSGLTIDNNIRSIFQDKKGNYWIGTNAEGVYKYDGNTIKQYTENDGLANNQILKIQEDHIGNIWFSTGLFGVSCLEGEKIITYTQKEQSTKIKSNHHMWNVEPNDLWFYAGDGAFHFKNNQLEHLPFPKKEQITNEIKSDPYALSRHAVYCLLKDKNNNIWFGTQAQGVCKFDGKLFTWFTDKGLAGPAVLGLFEDSKGNIWIGNNGSGLFKYDGEKLINITEEKSLSNKAFRMAGTSEPGTMARVYAINEDKEGNIWVGTVDAGVWKYNGYQLVNYTTNDGLSSNSVNTIFKDNTGELWFGTDANGICKFNGNSFYQLFK